MRYLFIFIFLFQSSIQIYSQSNLPVKKKSHQDLTTLFQELENYQKLIIQTDLDSMILNKNLDRYQPATISFYGKNQPTLKFKSKVKARGKFRRLKCNIPPLKINFSKSMLNYIILEFLIIFAFAYAM